MRHSDFTPKSFIPGLVLMLFSAPAFAAVRCQLSYTPAGPGAQPVLSLPRAFEAVPPGPGRSALVFDGNDGILMRAAATIQPNQAAEGRVPGTSLLSLTVAVSVNGRFGGTLGSLDSTQFFNYTGQRAKLLVSNLPPNRDIDFGTPQPPPPGSPPGTPPTQPKAKSAETPLTFKGPNADFSPRDAASLEGKAIVRVELLCAEGL